MPVLGVQCTPVLDYYHAKHKHCMKIETEFRKHVSNSKINKFPTSILARRARVYLHLTEELPLVDEVFNTLRTMTVPAQTHSLAKESGMKALRTATTNKRIHPMIGNSRCLQLYRTFYVIYYLTGVLPLNDSSDTITQSSVDFSVVQLTSTQLLSTTSSRSLAGRGRCDKNARGLRRRRGRFHGRTV
jgi:hypothetical protein